MAYGMKVINGSGTYIVDSTENFGHFHKIGSGTITGATPLTQEVFHTETYFL